MSSRSGKPVRWTMNACMVCGVIGSYWYYAKNCSRLNSARDNAKGCQQIAAQIEQVRQAPQKASLTTRSADDLGGVVEKAAADAQLARDRVLRIDPQPAKRLGKTEYLEQDTEVELLSVSMRQLVYFLSNLTNNDAGLAIGTLRLQMPHAISDTVGNELWLTNVVLTQRVYAPTTPHH